MFKSTCDCGTVIVSPFSRDVRCVCGLTVRLKDATQRSPTTIPSGESQIVPLVGGSANWVVDRLRQLKRPEDKGAGDTAARLIGAIGGEWIKSGLAVLGLDCGCDKRQEDMNARWPWKS